jgi:hypothetical protein
VVSPLQVFQPKHSMHFLTLPSVLRTAHLILRNSDVYPVARRYSQLSMYTAHTVLRIFHDFNYKKYSPILGRRYFFLEGLGQFGFREVTLSTLEVLSVAFVCVSDFILHIA